MRFRWLLLSILSSLLLALPAQAGKLLFWRFESNQNRLIFSTDSRVQPRAQLIPNPTRIVLDLPGIVLGRPAVTQMIGGTIKSIRVGQFNAQMTRLVIEIAPGYTVDPTQVRVRGISPTQWTVELPTPQRINQSTPSPLPSPNTPEPLRPVSPSTPSQQSNDFQVTRNGLFVRLDRNGKDNQIRSRRSEDKQSIEFTLPGAYLPQTLINQTRSVNEYGISDIRFEQTNNSPPETRITLKVSADSPDWQAYYSRLGGLVLLPKGGLSQVQGLQPPQPSPDINPPANNGPQNQNPTILGIQLINNNTQLIIQADRPIQGVGNLNRRTGVYEIRIPNAQLPESMQGPELGNNSPIYQLKVRQADANTVTILVQPSLGIRFGGLTQPNQQTIALDIRSLQASFPPGNPTNIPISPPSNPSFPPLDPDPPNLPSGNPRGRVLVVIDPGHGGKDPGAVGLGGLQEKDVILPISLDVAQLLRQGGVDVMMTRNSDYFVSLQGRTTLANQARANIFVSIHANAVGGGRSEVNGLEVFHSGNRELADAIHRSIIRSINMRDRGVKQARFYVLRNARMPSSLVEVGFVTGSEDNPRLADPAYRRQMAVAIAQGIFDYIRQKRL